MDQVITEGHLVLLLGFIKITIVHLEDSVLSINFSIVILLVDLDDLLQMFGLCQTQDFTPMGENFHPVEMSEFLLLDHSVPEIVSSDPHHLTLSVEIFE